MIRVLLSDPAIRDVIAAFLRFANLTVTYPENVKDTLYVDFAAFDFDEKVQLRIVERMLAAWQTEHRNAALADAEIAIHN